MVQSDRAHPGHGRKEIPTLAPSSTSHTPTAESQPVQTLPEEPADSSLPHDRSNLRHQLSAFWRYCNPQKAFENRGSTARDHLASERTFLAYVRTSLALASTGVVLVQLFTIADITSRTYNSPLTEANRRMQRFARPLGVAFVLLALIMLATGPLLLILRLFFFFLKKIIK